MLLTSWWGLDLESEECFHELEINSHKITAFHGENPGHIGAHILLANRTLRRLFDLLAADLQSTCELRFKLPL